MAIEYTTIQGTVRDLNGDTIPGAKIEIYLSCPGKVSDGTNNHFVGGKTIKEIEQDGTVDFELIPCDVITPLNGEAQGNVRYSFRYIPENGAEWIENDLNLETTPDPVDIGDIPRSPL